MGLVYTAWPGLAWLGWEVISLALDNRAGGGPSSRRDRRIRRLSYRIYDIKIQISSIYILFTFREFILYNGGSDGITQTGHS